METRKRETPQLAEPLEEQQSWEADGVVVLTADVSLPQLGGNDRRAKRFNCYYRRFCRAYFTYCRDVLLPEAAASCRDAMAASAPWSVSRAALRAAASRHAGGLLSVVCDAREERTGLRPFLIRRADVWDLSEGLPVPLGELFPPRVRWKKALVRFAREEARRRLERGEATYCDNYRVMLRRALNPRNYYLREDGLCFFYPAGAVADASAGVVSFTMPYDAERGPFLPPEA